MYKNLSLDELQKIDTKFFSYLSQLLKTQRYATIKDFLGAFKSYEKEYIFFKDSNLFFRVEKSDGYLIFRSDSEWIQLKIEETNLTRLHQLLRAYENGKRDFSINGNVISILENKFKKWDLRKVAWKPFIVYDIETLGNPSDLSSLQFEMGYFIDSSEWYNGAIKYRFVGSDRLKKFVDFLLEYNGRIVGFNNISFDNRVINYVVGYGQEQLDIINKKSLDLFLFIWKLTWRRLGLDKIASALVGIKKTLSSGLEGEKLILQYKKTGDEKLLQKVKNYCKNDVKMTLGVLLYLLEFGKISLDGKDYNFSEEDIIKVATEEINPSNKSTKELKLNTLF